MTSYNISNSLIKALDDYTLGEACGTQFRAIYLDKTASIIPSDAMKLGQYFEFIAIGATLRDGSEPQPETNRDGTLTAAYKRVEQQAINFNTQMKYYGFEIIKTGVTWEYQFEGLNIKGILDVLAKDRFQNDIIIDLKYSGLLGNKWEETGWTKETLHQKRKLISQPLLYSWLSLKLFGKIFPFYFFVHSSANTIDRSIFKVNVGLEKYLCEEVEKTIRFTHDMIEYHLLQGFEPRPEMKRCLACSLLHSCQYAFTLPKIDEVFLLFDSQH